MVFFTCNKCGESLKKKDVEKHSFTRCRGPPFLTCVDCLKDFREDYAKHTICVSEDARYSAKGLNGLKAQPKTKQQLWVETVHDTIQEFLEGSVSGVKPGVRHLMEYLKDLSTFPDKHKTFTNFIKNARRGESQENIDFIWSLFEKARANLQAKLAAERAAAEEAKRKAKEEKEAKEGKSAAVDSSSSSDSSDEDDDKKTKKEKLNKKMKELTVNTPSEGNEEEPSTSTTETGLNNELKSEKKKKKKKKSKGSNEEPETVATHLSMDGNDQGEKKQKKKRELSESESVINMSVVSSVQNGEKGKKNKKKKKSNSVCEPPEVQDIVENDGTGNDPTEENDKENSEDSDKKLSKKERKEKKKREKYEAQLKEIESNKSNEEEDDADNAEDEVTEDIERKKSKSKVNVAAQDPGIECGHDVKEKKTKKNKKRQREDDQISKLTTEDNHTNKKMKDNGVNGETQDGVESLAVEGRAKQEFQWDKTILQLLESQDGKEMSVKKLCKKVVNEYLSTLSEDAYVDDVKINSKFHKKLAKMHNIVVLKDKARIKTSRD